MVFDSAAESGGVSLNKLLLSGPDLAIRVVFDSAAESGGVSLNKLLLSGSDLGLRKTAEVGEPEFGPDAKEFVDNDFYVDDGLKSMPNSQQAIDLLQRTQAMLATGNLRLHKISSNDPKVMDAFPPDDRAADLRDLNLNHVNPPVQRSLGVSWDLKADTFTFTVDTGDEPFTKRGMLSIINSLYDPLGIAAPVLIQGKCLLRGMTEQMKQRQLEEWDLPFPVD